MLKLAVTGAAGRMGRRIIALAHESGDFRIVAAMETAGHSLLGRDSGVIAGIGEIQTEITIEPQKKPDVIIDFSVPDSTKIWSRYAAEHSVPLVVGTTGLSEEQKKDLQNTAEKTAVLWGANMSLGVNLLFKLVAEVARKLPDDYDIEVIEAHHRFKRDAPSGTAMELARSMADAKQWPLPDCLVHGREGNETLRREKTIGMHAVRGGDIVGRHSVLFAALGETIELSHQAHSRDTFVRGALRAAQWLSSRKAGMYSMFDVLEL